MTAIRVLTAAGPQQIAALEAAVARTHTRQHTPFPAAAQLAVGLVLSGARYDPDTQLWAAPNGAITRPADLLLISAATPGAIFSRRQIGGLLEAAGYAAPAAANARVDTHPLIQKIDRDQYQIVPTP